MRNTICVAAGKLAFLLCLCCSQSAALERPLDFLHALQARGYGKLAAEYVQLLLQRTDLPEDVTAILDLELATSLRVAAQETKNADEAELLLGQAQAQLEKFLKQRGDHPQAAAAFVTFGDIELARGQQLIVAARGPQAGQRAPQLLTEARAALEKARSPLAKAVELYQAQREAAEDTGKKPPTARSTRSKKQTEDLEEAWLESRFKLSTIDYQVGRTYTNPKDAARKTAFTAAGKGFDAIYQQFRTTRVGLFAHMWHAKVLEEMGDLQTALDVYDEVLVNAPDPNERRVDEAVASLFADVQYSRLRILSQKGQLEDLREEAQEWLRLNKQGARDTMGYQGIALELAKAQLALAAKMKADEQRKTVQAAVVLLSDVAKVPSPYQQEAILLRRAQTAKLGGTEVKTFDEALALATESKATADWAAAVKAFSRALELKATTKNAEQVELARLELARAQYLSGDVAAAQATAESLAREAPKSPSAPGAASLAVNSALNLYSSATDKEAARNKLLSIAEFTVKQWPERSEADDARISLGKLQMVRGELDPALASLEGVNNASDRRPTALGLAAQIYWRKYLDEKRKPAAGRNLPLMESSRAKTLEQLNAALSHPSVPATSKAAWPQSLQEAQLLLAEVRLEGADVKGAGELLAPLLESVSGGQGKALDNYALRVFIGSIRVKLLEKDLAKTSEIALSLAEVGEDSPLVNSVLIDVIRNVKQEWKQAQAAQPAEGQDPPAGETPEPGDAQKQVLIGLLQPVAARKQHPVVNLVFIGDTCLEVGMTDQARDVYLSFLEKSAKDEAFLKANADSVTRVRARLVGVLRRQEKYEDALKEVDVLLKEKPNSLEALLERGRILQAWGETEPKHLEEAVAQFTRIRLGLQRLPKKPPEYYEAVYSASACLVQQSIHTKDKTKALQAEQILKSTLVLSPALDGPDTVAEFKTLLDEAAVAQGRTVAKPKPANP